MDCLPTAKLSRGISLELAPRDHPRESGAGCRSFPRLLASYGSTIGSLVQCQNRDRLGIGRDTRARPGVVLPRHRNLLFLT